MDSGSGENGLMKKWYLLACIATCLLLAGNTFAQSTTNTPVSDRATQLGIVQSVLSAKLSERRELRQKIGTATPDDIDDLEVSLVELNASIDELRVSFEQIAVGTVDLSVFSGEVKEFDWRTEMTDVLMPIIRNLQALTEKPRRIEALKTQIATNDEQLIAVNEALSSIEKSLSVLDDGDAKQSLNSLLMTWQDRATELARSTEVANARLDNILESDGNLADNLKEGFIEFVKGRGLTLAIAILAALAVWHIAKLLTKLLSTRSSSEAVDTFRTRQRVVQYGFNVLTGLLMAIAVIVVFYTRGDVLLLGLSFLFVGAMILGLRHAVPKFLAEAKLLLNLGSIREGERVVYNGLPFQIASLNMYSVLKNPELTGVIRLPLESMMGMISRPAGKELWFPASKGDFIMFSDDNLLEVISMTTELVQLKNLAGTRSTVPAADFYNMTFDNITRGEKFSVIETFGVGYSHQNIINDDIPRALQHALEERLNTMDFAEHIVSVAVELKEAGASSLDYWVCVTLSYEGARAHKKIGRLIQQTCVATCTSNEWDIPFPQLTIHNR